MQNWPIASVGVSVQKREKSHFVKDKLTSSRCVCVCVCVDMCELFSTLSNFPEVSRSLPLLRAPADEFLLWVWSPRAIR